MQSQPLQNLGATVNLWFVLFGLSYPEETRSTGFSSKPGGFLVFSEALSILEVQKSNQKLYLVWPRGNSLSLQTGELDKTVIFPLSTLSVLRDNDVVVEIELPVLDTLATSAESSGSNSSTWLKLYFESLHVEMLFYKPSDVMTTSRVCWEGFRGFRCVVFHVEYSISKIGMFIRFNVSVGSTGIVRGEDVRWFHVVFRAKTAGGSGGGVTSQAMKDLTLVALVDVGHSRIAFTFSSSTLTSCF
ncbi:uncharacterized protein E5676_scaffold302G001720 [Cucumis melo var. makuwa]|uniref:Uncharacterized protein n=1 Tax=Cucumis melo var. makuwa TaxID=1194695 RepID=A0A5A7UEC1_CUCMM|nr:uncharacterized protein E6C27_scaffold24G00800 [Cucumis melo var. makuwa]TYK12390.1 uncharacterized protein E5676_scaffold302G001720 [Cucumis melo var. makuwa]